MGRDDASRANISHDSMVDVLLPSITCPARDARDGNLGTSEISVMVVCARRCHERHLCRARTCSGGEACTAVDPGGERNTRITLKLF